MKPSIKDFFKIKKVLSISILSAIAALSISSQAEPILEKEIKVTDSVLYFNGSRYASTGSAVKSKPDLREDLYDYMYGKALTPHGDCIKVYKQYVFMTWYKGGKFNRKLMLTRYNTETGSMATIEFPHRHSGYQNRWWVGETHNTVSIGLSPKNQSIHMVFDQHSLSASNPVDGTAANDYFKYYYSKPNSLTVPDSKFTLDLFVKDTYFSGNDPVNPLTDPKNERDEYKHLTLTGVINSNQFSSLTYPKFFLTSEGDLFLYMRKGRSENGRFAYIKYDGKKWQSSFKEFNYSEAKSRGFDYNYGVYGEMKYVGGKIRIGFQQRANVSTDRYVHQNGFFAAYSEDPAGITDWKNYKGESIATPLLDTNLIKVSEPGDVVTGNEKDRFSMVGGFDWTVTDRGDVHFVGKVVDTITKKITYVHTYRKAGDTKFTTSTNFSGAEELYVSGNNIYIFGLDSSGRPYIEQATGGENNFTRIYEESSGRQFEKGVAHISGGKLYYYLLEKHDGSNPINRTTYLKIIDLDLQKKLEGPTGYSFSANENETVKINGAMDIAYGANGLFNFIYDQTANVVCSNSVFGDPIPRTRKQCYTKSVAPVLSECSTFIPVVHNTQTEVMLKAGACLRFSQNLKGKTLQLWDSDANASCDYRGTATAAAGSGSIAVTANYVSSNLFSGTDIKFVNASDNTCQFIKVRAY